MNKSDMKEMNLKKLDVVDLMSHFKGETRSAYKFLVIPYDIPKQCTATYFPETNVLVPLHNKADISNTPASKTITITIHKV
jgi:anaerobic selenocysteine-containing dehydrogenase